MSEFFTAQCIEVEPTSGYSPQENGVAERDIGILKELLQCLLSDSGLKDTFRAEALWHACYLYKITSSTGDTKPRERSKYSKPDASSLKMWCCKA
jgi:hypothetical protein